MSDTFIKDTPPNIYKPKRFLVRIEYPAQPSEVIINAMQITLSEEAARTVANEYIGNIKVETVDEKGLHYRKYGRIVLREIKQS